MSLSTRVSNRLARVRQHRWRTRGHRSSERHVVIGGSPRSGTTLLRRLLDEHPACCCGPESNILLPGPIDHARLAQGYGIPEAELRDLVRRCPSQAAFVDAFALRYRALRGRRRWAEKTPLNIWHVGWVLARFPEARVIHVIRDGRDVVCSMRDFPERRWTRNGWVDTPRGLPVEEYARRWVTHTGKGMAWRGDPRYLEVRYEALVESPGQVLAEVLRFLGEEAVSIRPERSGVDQPDGGAAGRPDAAGAIGTGSRGRWRRDLSPRDQEAVRRVAGARLVELGYAEDGAW